MAKLYPVVEFCPRAGVLLKKQLKYNIKLNNKKKSRERAFAFHPFLC